MRRLKTIYSVEMPIGVTITCLVNKVEKIDTRLIGYEEDSFIILKFPYLTCIKKYLAENMPVNASFSCGNTNIFFTSYIETAVIKKFLAICDYPPHFKMIDLRKARRVQCLVPAGISLDTGYHYGVLRDISAGGCQLVLNAAHMEVPALPEVNETLALELGPQNSTQLLTGTIKHVQKNKNLTALGIAFMSLADREVSKLEDYVQRLSDNRF